MCRHVFVSKRAFHNNDHGNPNKLHALKRLVLFLQIIFLVSKDNENDGTMSANREVSLTTVEDKIAAQQPNCFKVAGADPVCCDAFTHNLMLKMSRLDVTAQRFAPFVSMPDCIPAKKPRESIDLAVLSPLWIQFMAWQQLGVVC